MSAPRPGDPFRLDLGETVITGRYIEVDSPRRMVIEWDRDATVQVTPAPARIEITFTPMSDGRTAVEIQLSGLSAEDATFYPQLLERYLDRLADAAAGAESGVLRSNHLRDVTSDANPRRASSTDGNPSATQW